jgi:hypothetical protein
MNRFLFRRIFTALLVLTFMVGLPTQGISTVAPTPNSSAPWMMDNMTPASDDCSDCNTSPLMSAMCPIVFCLGLTGIILETPEVGNQLSNLHFRSIPATKVGLPIPPNIEPPRTTVHI